MAQTHRGVVAVWFVPTECSPIFHRIALIRAASPVGKPHSDIADTAVVTLRARCGGGAVSDVDFPEECNAGSLYAVDFIARA